VSANIPKKLPVFATQMTSKKRHVVVTDVCSSPKVKVAIVSATKVTLGQVEVGTAVHRGKLQPFKNC